jgi:hypothetical protein
MRLVFGRGIHCLRYPLALVPVFLAIYVAISTQQLSSAYHLQAAPDTRSTQTPGPGADTIPAGTILPVRLPAISSAKVMKGDTLKASLAQDVPLPTGKIRRGTSVLGSIRSTSALAPGAGANIAVSFDTLVQHGKSTPIQTGLRALASTMEVQEAQIPTFGAGQSDVYDWLSTRQVGGDVVYGKGGPVVAESGTVGKSVYAGGVLVQLLANAQGGCRGSIAGDDRPQALWVFSAAACGLYGFQHLQIRHAGRTAPLGEIILESTKGPVRIRSGSGALLRVITGSGENSAAQTGSAIKQPIRSGTSGESAAR